MVKGPVGQRDQHRIPGIAFLPDQPRRQTEDMFVLHTLVAVGLNRMIGTLIKPPLDKILDDMTPLLIAKQADIDLKQIFFQGLPFIIIIIIVDQVFEYSFLVLFADVSQLKYIFINLD